jgi:hypothetical protein
LLCRVVCFVVLGGWVFFCPSRWPRHSICSLEAFCGDRWGMEHRAQETAFPQVSDLREWSG